MHRAANALSCSCAKRVPTTPADQKEVVPHERPNYFVRVPCGAIQKGAPSGEFTTVTMYKNFAGLDEGDPLVIGTGRETAAAINAKVNALSTPIQFVIRRRIAELSF